MATEMELAYTAGIVDGEGYFSIHHGRGWNSTIGVNNTDFRILFWLRDHFGGYIHFTGARAKPQHKQLGMWISQSREAEDFIRSIRPYLILKAERADIFLAFRRTIKPRGHRRGEALHLDPAVIETREVLRKQIRVLNQRGIAAGQ